MLFLPEPTWLHVGLTPNLYLFTFSSGFVLFFVVVVVAATAAFVFNSLEGDLNLLEIPGAISWVLNNKTCIHVSVWLARFLAFCCVHVFCLFFFFFFFLRVNSNLTWVYCLTLFIHCLRIKNIKIGLTILFTHLKIISLQCFQFSATINSIQTDPYQLI